MSKTNDDVSALQIVGFHQLPGGGPLRPRYGSPVISEEQGERFAIFADAPRETTLADQQQPAADSDEEVWNAWRQGP